jgi:hypothetical protein
VQTVAQTTVQHQKITPTVFFLPNLSGVWQILSMASFTCRFVIR